MNDFEAFFDYNDINNIDQLKIMSDNAALTENEFIKSAYQYDFIIQINLTAVNGVALKNGKDDKKSKEKLKR